DRRRHARPAGRRVRLAPPERVAVDSHLEICDGVPERHTHEHMRRRLVASAVAVLMIAAPAAAAGLPKAGTLVPGRSLGGVRLGESPSTIRAALGRFYGTCRSCARRPSGLTYRPVHTRRLAVAFERGRCPGAYPAG